MDAKEAARERMNTARDGLVDLSHRIQANPELRFKEEKASAWVAEALSEGGFDVELGVHDLPTAFIARSGSGPLHIAICAEYDALPGIGHACGHNIIATAAIGAGLAAAKVADDVGLTVTVFGTPAEEGGGGKILLLERGAFEGQHAAMMVHPAPMDTLEPMMIAIEQWGVKYTGKSAHAAAAPQQGINAADALTVAQVAIGLLRQHMRSTDRVHGIVTDGGDAPNIIPAHTAARYSVRARSLEHLDKMREQVRRCFEAGAIATGATLEITTKTPYAQMEHDVAMVEVYRHNAEALGRTFADVGGRRDLSGGSTDMGNVSLVMPTIHPMIGIDSLPAVNHQPEFAAHCITEAADRAVYDGALAMAWTAIDLALDEKQRDRLMAGH